MNRILLLAAALAPALAVRAGAQASLVNGGVKYPVPAPLRESVEARKAGLAPLKIGVGQFQHMYSVKLGELGLPSYKPVGPAEAYDFATKIPKGWEVGSHNGEWFFENTSASQSAYFLLDGRHEDFTVDVSVRWVAGAEDNTIGVIMDYTKDGCYILGVSHQDSFLVWKSAGGQGAPIHSWEKAEGVIVHDGANALHIERHGDKLSLSINGHPVYEGTDGALSGGQIGLYLGGKTTAAFSKFSIQETKLDEAAETVLGSGYDYADEFMDGMVRSGLFKPDQVGPSNFPKGETWDYVIENPSLTTSTRGGVQVVVKRRETGDVILDQSLPLPTEWDQRPYVQMDSGATARDAVMRRLGEYVAYELADKLLPAAPPAPAKTR